jgi:hypothetical protein
LGPGEHGPGRDIDASLGEELGRGGRNHRAWWRVGGRSGRWSSPHPTAGTPRLLRLAESWTEASMRPSEKTIRRRFGSFREAIQQAALT